MFQNTSLSNNFLQDLEDLDEEFEEQIDDLDEKNNLQNDIDQIRKDFENKDKKMTNLSQDEEFINHNKSIKEILEKSSDNSSQKTLDKNQYNILLKSIEYSNILDREISLSHLMCKELYQPKFPELESLVLNPLDYVQCVLKIQNQMDLNKVDLSEILTSHQIVAVNVAGSATSGKILQTLDLKKVVDACNLLLELDESKKLNLKFVESKMLYLAPNLCNLIGSMIAAQLMAASGGLLALSRMPACNIQVIGSSKKHMQMLGFSKVEGGLHLGLFGTMEMVKRAPQSYQVRLVRMLSTNCAKASRIDQSRMCPDGSLGKKLYNDLMQRFSKIQEPPPAKKIKPLAIPDEKPRKKRGGKKHRNMKEKLEQTELRKLANRMSFGEEAEKEHGFTGVGFGMLGVGTGKVKIKVKEKKMALTKKQMQQQQNYNNKLNKDGVASSIAFTPVQSMQLMNPALLRPGTMTENYFNKETGFRTVVAEQKNKNLLQNLLNP